MAYWYVLDWMNAVGTDEGKRKKAREALIDIRIKYEIYRNAQPATQEAKILDVDFGIMQINYQDRFSPREERMRKSDMENYKPRFVNEPPSLPE